MSVNKVIIIGRLARDAEVRKTQAGETIANFSVATSETWKDKNSGEKKEKSEYHRVVAFNRLGEICAQYLCKGKQVYIEGRLQTRSWEKDGITRYTTEIVATDMQMLGDSAGSQGGGDRDGNSGYPTPKPEPHQQPRQQQSQYAEDDIPF